MEEWWEESESWGKLFEQTERLACMAHALHDGVTRDLRRLAGWLAKDVEVARAGGVRRPVTVEVGTVAGCRAVRFRFPVTVVPFHRWMRLSPENRWAVAADKEARGLWEDLVGETRPHLAVHGQFEAAYIHIRHVIPSGRRVNVDSFDYAVNYILDALTFVGWLAGHRCDQVKYTYTMEVTCDQRAEGFVEVVIVEPPFEVECAFVPSDSGSPEGERER